LKVRRISRIRVQQVEMRLERAASESTQEEEGPS
jgi:hypothetical protein